MNRDTRVILSLGLLGLALTLGPGVAEVEAQKPSNNMWTRSAALYLDRAQNNPRPEAKRELYQQALEASLEGIQNDPGNPRVYFLAGQAHVKLGNLVAADSMFDKAEEIFPEYAEEINLERQNAWVVAYNAGVGALQGNQPEQAKEHLQRAHVIFQGRPEAILNLGSIYAREQEHEQAVAAYREALEILRGPAREQLPPQREEQWTEHEEIASFNLAQILATQGKDEEAAQAYRDFLAREPDDGTAKLNLAVVLSRMGNDEEARQLYDELLAMEDVSSDTYFRVGLGLFGAEQYDRAAEAFRMAVETNPHNRDALYNLGQAIYAKTRELEETVAAAGAGAEEAKTEARELYQELDRVSEQVLALDPSNRNVVLLHAQAFRGLSDLAASDAESQELRERALALLERNEAMTVQVINVQMDPVRDGKTTIRGVLENLKAEEGQPVTLRFTLLDDSGAELSAGEVTVPAPAAEQQVPFQVELEAPGEVSGWKYAIAG